MRWRAKKGLTRDQALVAWGVKASEYVAQLRAEIAQLNSETLSTALLLKYLDGEISQLIELERTDGDPMLQAQRVEQYKAQCAIHLEQFRAQNAGHSQLFASVIDYAQRAINAVVYINAGAAIALLSFIGTHDGEARVLGRPLLIFVLGVLSGALAHGGAYLAQYCYAEEGPKSKGGDRLRLATAGAVVIGYLCFVAAAIGAYHGLTGGSCCGTCPVP